MQGHDVIFVAGLQAAASIEPRRQVGVIARQLLPSDAVIQGDGWRATPANRAAQLEFARGTAQDEWRQLQAGLVALRLQRPGERVGTHALQSPLAGQAIFREGPVAAQPSGTHQQRRLTRIQRQLWPVQLQLPAGCVQHVPHGAAQVHRHLATTAVPQLEHRRVAFSRECAARETLVGEAPLPAQVQPQGQLLVEADFATGLDKTLWRAHFQLRQGQLPVLQVGRDSDALNGLGRIGAAAPLQVGEFEHAQADIDRQRQVLGAPRWSIGRFRLCLLQAGADTRCLEARQVQTAGQQRARRPVQ